MISPSNSFKAISGMLRNFQLHTYIVQVIWLSKELVDDVSLQVIIYFFEPRVRSNAGTDFVKKITDFCCKLITYAPSPSLPSVNTLL
jgi:hypothetical protein